jgi:membrane-associated PAP2 superfamily phosphatase
MMATISSAETCPPTAGRHQLRWVSGLWVPLATLILLSLLINWFDLDRRVAAPLFVPETGWVHDQDGWVQFFYRFGNFPANAIAAVALVVLLVSYFRTALRQHSRLALFLVLLLILGPGVVVNEVFKKHYGRPRPREVVDFGGEQNFVPALKPNFSGEGRSFPSGHASMGFYWLGLFVYWYGTRRRDAWLCLAAGLIQGGLMGAGRILQGGHWLSDVMWSAGFIYLIAWCLSGITWIRPASSSSSGQPLEENPASPPQTAPGDSNPGTITTTYRT